jgi:hypothetical protein
LQPLIDLSLALKTLDVPNLGPRIVGFDLPIAFGNPFHFENDTLFSHEAEYRPLGLGCKPKTLALFKLTTTHERYLLTRRSIDGGRQVGDKERGLTVTKEVDHSTDLSRARQKLLAEHRELAADLTKPYQRGDSEKRERFMVIQSMIEAIDRAIADEERLARGECAR